MTMRSPESHSPFNTALSPTPQSHLNFDFSSFTPTKMLQTQSNALYSTPPPQIIYHTKPYLTHGENQLSLPKLY